MSVIDSVDHQSLPRFSPSAGAGLKHEHARDILHTNLPIGFFEVHAESYLGAGGPPHDLLMKVRADYPLCIHDVGLSIGTALPLNKDHLARLKRLIDRYQPELFSEHLAWSSHGDVFLNDLLPLPYNETTLARVSEHVHQIQNVLGIRILLENPSSYLSFASSTISEIEFLRAIVERTGCGLLLEMLRGRAYHAADATPVGRAVRLANLRMALHPSIALFMSRFPVVTVWEANYDEAGDFMIRQWGAEQALVARPFLEVDVWRLPAAGLAFLTALGKGATLAAATEVATATTAEFDFAAGLALLIESHIVVGFQSDDNTGRLNWCETIIAHGLASTAHHAGLGERPR